jgi:hypothetical protein
LALIFLFATLIPALASSTAYRTITWKVMISANIVFCISFLILAIIHGQVGPEPSIALCTLQAALMRVFIPLPLLVAKTCLSVMLPPFCASIIHSRQSLPFTTRQGSHFRPCFRHRGGLKSGLRFSLWMTKLPIAEQAPLRDRPLSDSQRKTHHICSFSRLILFMFQH